MCTVQGPPPRKPVPQAMPGDQPLPYYLDHNATTPLCDEAWHALTGVRHAWGNASSLHPYGLEARLHLDAARDAVRHSMRVGSPECVIFTGSGTEANNLAIVGGLARVRRAAAAGAAAKRVIITTAYEHPAVEEVLQQLEAGAHNDVTVLRCRVGAADGVVDVAEFARLVSQNVQHIALVTVMHANNELGSINPIAQLVRIVRDAEVANGVAVPCLFHTDASQSVGKIDVALPSLGVDMLTVCGHKFYGPKGVGALVVRDVATCTPDPVLRGAKHERGIRPGTENLLLLAAFAAALTAAVDNLEANAAHARACRDKLYAELRRILVVDSGATFDIVENGAVATALPNTLNIAIYHRPSRLFISAARLITQLGRKIAMSSGSACHAAEDGVHVPVSAPLKAVGADLERAIGTLRLTTGKLNKLEDMTRVAQILAHACKAQMPEAVTI